MNDIEKLRAINHAQNWIIDQGFPFDINVDFEPDEISEAETGCWVRAWVYVPREAYED